MKTVYYVVSVRDGFYRREERVFEIEVEDDAEAGEIDDAVWDDIQNNRIEWTWGLSREEVR